MTDPLFDLDGRVVVVTGGLGQLGQQFSRTLLQRGVRVAATDIDIDPHRLSADLETHRREGRLKLIESDVTNRAALKAALAEITSAWPAPYGLINNAALDSPPDAPIEDTGPFETFPEASWDRAMNVNVKGVFLASQVFGAAMAAEGRGSIINISSTYGMVSPDQRIYEYQRSEGRPFYKPVAYSASKSALYNLTRYVATYWATAGVRANILTLGGVFNHQDERFITGYTARVPMGRMAEADDYDGAIVFLLSSAAAYMTGANLVIDGGWTAW